MSSQHTYMAESLRLVVPVVVDLALLLLSAIVPRQLKQPLPLSNRIISALSRLRVRRRVSQEVEVERSLLILDRPYKRHPQDFLVVLETGLGVLHAEHGMVQPVGRRVRRRTHSLISALDDLNPVSIGIFNKSNMPHATLGKLLLKRVPSILEPLAGCLDVVDGDGDVTVAPVRLGVSVGDAVVGVVLGAVVVG